MSLLEKINQKIKLTEELIARADLKSKICSKEKDYNKSFYWLGVKVSHESFLKDLREIQTEVEMVNQSINDGLDFLRGK